MYSGLSSTNWMFIEGLHLHSRLTSRVFQKEAPLAAYHILGWGKRKFDVKIKEKI